MFASVNSQNTLFSYENLNIEKKELVKLQNENKTPLEIPSDQIGGVRVIFEDKNKNLISINLSEENFKSLQENFRSYTNYIPKEDGSIRLNAEAENFISSWFNTALNLDSAKINSNLYDDYNPMSFKKDRPTLNQSLNQLGKSNFNAIDENASITQRLNFLIDKDVNKDGKIELGESKPDGPRNIKFS